MALGKLRPSTALLVTQGSFKGSPRSEPSDASSVDLEKGSTFDSASSELSTVRKIPAQLLDIGDVVRVVQGTSPPADGELVNFSAEYASFDESSLSGESKPVKKYVGDQVFVGTINQGASVDVRVAAIGGQTM